MFPNLTSFQASSYKYNMVQDDLPTLVLCFSQSRKCRYFFATTILRTIYQVDYSKTVLLLSQSWLWYHVWYLQFINRDASWGLHSQKYNASISFWYLKNDSCKSLFSNCCLTFSACDKLFVQLYCIPNCCCSSSPRAKSIFSWAYRWECSCFGALRIRREVGQWTTC